jgi:hypothetical protein
MPVFGDEGSRPATPPGQPCHSCRGSFTLTYGAGGGNPVGPYLSLGVAIGDIRYNGPAVAMGTFKGALLQLDVGRGGLSGSLGTPILAVAKIPRHCEPWAVAVAGVAIKATVLRTWEGAIGLPPGQTYAGASLEVLALFHLRFGVLAHVSGAGPRGHIWTWGVGLGF